MISCLCFLTPIGYCTLYEDNGYICQLSFGQTASQKVTSALQKAKTELEEYLNGTRKNFDIMLSLQRGTIFQQQVWHAISAIDYGKTKTYKQIAENIGHEKAVRAVGNACNRNPLPIFIPCHRVIGSNQKPIGYNGGLKIKKYLLELEQKCL